jgi:arsenate reductase-like glutaredoxin family protein
MAATPLKTTLTKTNLSQADLYTLLSSLVTAVNALKTDHGTLIAKLNSDAGVTDTNYAASTANTLKLTKG